MTSDSHQIPVRVKAGDLVQMDGLAPGSYRVRQVKGSRVEVEHAVTGAPAGIWPIDVTIPVREARDGPQ